MIFISSCKSTKFVPENKFLLTKNQIVINNKKASNSTLYPYLIQKPNSKSLGLFFYNLGNKDYEKKWDAKIIKFKDSNYFLTKLLSLKQMIGYANYKKDINRGLFKIGEKPIILDTLKIKKTLQNIKLYYIYEGFFKTKVAYKIKEVDTKKAKVIYQIDTDKAYFIDSIKYNIASPIIDSLYKLNKEGSFIKEKQQFKRSNFENEATRLTQIFRNAGVYHFSKYSINFKEIDSTNSSFKTNVLVEIADRIVEENDSLVSFPFQISKIKKIEVYTDYSYSARNKLVKDSVNYKGISYYAYHKINYIPRLLALSIFIKPGQNYSDINRDRTRQHLQDLAAFKSIRIKYKDIGNNQLIATLLLTPNKQYNFKLESEFTHNNSKPYAISGKLSYKNNNTFKRNEIFKLGLQGSFINVKENNLFTPFFNAWELGVDASYKIPRFLIPFYKNNSFLRKFTPNTTFLLGTSLQKNIGLDKQRFTTITAYNWETNKRASHTLELFNTQFIRNLNVGSFFKIYASEYRKLQTIKKDNPIYLTGDLDKENAFQFLNEAFANVDFQNNNSEDYLKIKNIKKRYAIITEDVLVPTITYQLVYNTQSSFKDTDYSFVKAKFASSGLLTSSLSKNTNKEGVKQLFGINVAQYLKLDVEYRKHWDIGYNNVFAFRTSVGYALPYGNSNSIPFSRSYFAGGPNDIRAWKIYDLGPGGEDTGLEFNVGNFKLLTNIEYRFDIVSSFKGALFVDAGNIWDTTNSSLTSDKAKFNSIKSLQNIAIGTGVGLRYDFSFIVFRLDLGFKTYEPYKTSGAKWFQVSSLKKPTFNLGINYPF